MANPSGSHIEAAYARAMAAFQEGSLEAARRLTIEILTEDPGHAGARALRTRIDARMGAGRATPTTTPGSGRSAYSGRGNVPEATSVDPTMLIDRADRHPPEHIEPTVIVQRGDVPRHRTPREAPPPPPAARRPAESVSQPTVLISPKNRNGSASRGGRSSGSFIRGLWARSKPGREPARRPSRQPGTGFWTPVTRGIVMAVGGIIVASLFVLGAVAIGRWLSTDTYALTFTKPQNGTIRGAGLTCGTGGDECSIRVKSGQAIELETVADDKYVFSAYTGDCPASGRFTMTQARSCGARFDTSVGSRDVTFPLTIIKPTGGTIVVAGGIVCGTNGDACSINLPLGAPVTIVAEADTGYRFVSFTGDCAINGETTMTAGRTCGSNFLKVEGPVVAERPSAPKENPPPPAKSRVAPAPSSPAPTPSQGTRPAETPPQSSPPPSSPPPTVGPAPAPAPVTVVAPTVTPEAQAKAVTPVDSELEHAKKEIKGLVDKYCAALASLDPRRVQAVFPRANVETLKSQYKNYKSLKCTVTSKEPDFERIDVAGAGGAQLKFDMKQAMEMKVGGAPSTTELEVTMRVARRNAQEPWTIDWVESAPKPK